MLRRALIVVRAGRRSAPMKRPAHAQLVVSGGSSYEDHHEPPKESHNA